MNQANISLIVYKKSYDKIKIECEMFSGKLCTTRMSKEEIESQQVPLGERMLREPFWFGLLTVFVVMIMIGIGYQMKKHLPDKIVRIFGTGNEEGRLLGSYSEQSIG